MNAKSFTLLFSGCLLIATAFPAIAGSDSDRDQGRASHREHAVAYRDGHDRGDGRFNAEAYRRGGYYYFTYRPRWNFGFGVWPWWGPRYYQHYYDKIPADVVREYPVYWERPIRYGGSLETDVQRALAKRACYAGPIDGLVGPETRGAILTYQKRYHLAQTGEIEPDLMRSLGLL